jgi:cytochrome c oxidase subunit II
MQRMNMQQTSSRQGRLCRLYWLSWLALAVLLAGCAPEAPKGRTTPSMLDAKGTGAAIISQEWWILLAAGTAITLLVTVLMLWAVARQKRRDADGQAARENAGGGQVDLRDMPAEAHAGGGTRWIWLGGIAMPLVVLLGVFALTVMDLRALGAAPSPETAAVQVNGHRWWWEVEYPDLGITTANQIYVPVGQAVKIQLTAYDVIHSFWVPQLQFKRDLIPGQMNTMWLQADKPGIYRGLCAEYCGLQHAQMNFMVVALEPKDYEQWVAHEGSDAEKPTEPLAKAGQQVFLGKNCMYCHSIRGTSAAGWLGPDLTHLASRLTIAGGSLENNTGNLGGWILDPQHIKPGALMPATPMSGQELQELLAYLNSLK